MTPKVWSKQSPTLRESNLGAGYLQLHITYGYFESTSVVSEMQTVCME